jgi:hypothetical protein
MSSTTPELAYEGHARFADGTMISLQCHEGRCGECPDETPDGQAGSSGALDGYPCEHGCGHGPAADRQVVPEPDGAAGLGGQPGQARR